ncbi:MAG: YfbM family protein [Planctomycetaceae bacterium]|nr:YfbM family protein [Planctomycetaceae bacterium]
MFLNSQLYRSRERLRIYSDAPRKGDDMGCLGIHLALTGDEANKLKSQLNDDARRDYLLEELEDKYFSEEQDFLAESDKAWDGIHRALTDGRFTYDNGEYPLSHVVMGGEIVYHQSDYIMVLKSPKEVKDVANAIRDITEDNFKARYRKIDQALCEWPLSEEDCDYSWHWFQEVRNVFERAAQANRYVLFTASQ